jgi:hypothetical protein
MNTYEARLNMRDLARHAIEIVDRIGAGTHPTFDDQSTLRRLSSESRVLLAEAGYPGEAAWRGIHRASIGIDTQLSSSDPGFWRDVREDLQGSVDTLDSLVSTPYSRDIDFRIVG